MVFAAYNEWGDLIADGSTYLKAFNRAISAGYYEDEFIVVTVTA